MELSMTLKILLIADSGTWSEAAAERLRGDGHACTACAADAPERAGRMAAEQEADLVVADLDAIGRAFGAYARAIRAARTDCRILLVTGRLEDAIVRAALAAGVSGILLKDAQVVAVSAAVDEVLAGGACFPETVRDRIIVTADGPRLGPHKDPPSEDAGPPNGGP
ncbi:MAG: response regulator [Phycisphaerae bacterium]